MALFDAFKQQVLNLGRSEARAKARPLLVDDEAFDRSAAGLDRRTSEGFVLFWLLSDRALYLVAGGASGDWAFRIPYECIAEMALDFDETAETLPWYIRLTLFSEGKGAITTLEDVEELGKPLAAPLPRVIGDGEQERFAQGAIIPLAGFAVVTRKFRTALARRLELTGGTLHVHGEDRAAAQRRLPALKRPKDAE
ncbi:MAG: hypothetical protein U9R51_04990 [Actinomycetota bacterium]|nr:hypothetical protein [Actinomycetota bacterium]